MIVLWWLGALWSMPNTLIGLALALPYGAREWRWEDGALVATVDRAIGNPGAQTWGLVIYAVGDSNRASLSGRLGIHERHHVKQGLWLGPLFLVAYGLEWLVRFATYPGPHPGDWPRWFRAYWHLTWERAARRAAGEQVEWPA